MISVCTEMVLLISYWVSWTPLFNWFPVLCVTPSLFISVVPWIWSLWMTKPYVLSVPQFLFSDHRCFFLLRSYSGALTSTDPANAFSVIVNRSDKSWHPCFVTDLKKKSFQLFTVEYVSCGLINIAFIMLRYIPSISNLLRLFITQVCWILSNAFPTSIEMII